MGAVTNLKAKLREFFKTRPIQAVQTDSDTFADKLGSHLLPYTAGTGPLTGTGAIKGDRVGEMYVYTASNPYTLYLWNGSAWVASDEVAQSAAGSTAGDIAALQTAVTDAQGDATSALTALTEIAADDKLTPSEKQSVLRDYRDLYASKTYNDQQADLYGISRTAYDAAIDGLVAYMVSLGLTLGTNDAAWSSGTTTIDGPTLRTTFAAAHDAEVALLTAVVEAAKAASDSKPITFMQPDEPPGPLPTGSLWVDTDDFNTLHRWNGSAWVEAQNLAQTLTLTSTAQAFTYNSGGYAAPSGQSIVFTAALQNIASTVSWDCKGYNADKTLYGDLYFPGTNLERTLSVASFSTCAYAVITATAEGWTDKITIVRLKDGTNGGDGTDGENAVVGYLTNESVTIAATDTGDVADWGPAGGTFRVYDGLAEQTNTLNVNYAVESATGVSITIGSTNGVYSVSGMSADTGTATLRCIYNGGTVTLRKVYSIAKSKAGPAGTDGTNGTNGERGAGFYTASDTGATAPTNEAFTVLANNATPGGNVFQDRVTIYNNSATPPWSVTKYWDGDTWEPLTQYLDGNLLVSGTVAADAFIGNIIKTPNYTFDGTEGTASEVATAGAKMQTKTGGLALLAAVDGVKFGATKFSDLWSWGSRRRAGAHSGSASNAWLSLASMTGGSDGGSFTRGCVALGTLGDSLKVTQAGNYHITWRAQVGRSTVGAYICRLYNTRTGTAMGDTVTVYSPVAGADAVLGADQFITAMVANDELVFQVWCDSGVTYYVRNYVLTISRLPD